MSLEDRPEGASARLLRHALVTVAAGTLALTACRAPRQTVPRVNGEAQTLASIEDGDGEVSYALATSPRTVSLVIRHTRDIAAGYAGFEVTDLADEEAREIGVTPLQGPIVVRVRPDSPAARGGLRPGDIILAIGSSPADSARQLRRMLAAWRSGQPDLVLEVRRDRTSPGEPIELRITPEPRRQRQEQREEVLLDDVAASPADEGLLLATIPAAIAETLYGLPAPQVIVADVFLGSPAWRAGLRSGDRIVAVDSRPYASARKLAGDIRDWRRENTIDAVRLEVIGPAGPLATSLELDDPAERHRFLVPPLVDVETSRRRTEWNLLLVLLNYRSRPEPSPGRIARSRSKLSVLLDAFAVERGPQGLGFTFLWFIHI